LLGPRGETMDAEGFADNVARAHARIERGKRILEHDLHLAPDRAHFRLAETRDVLSVDADFARCRLDQPQHAARHRRFAATGFADQPQRLADVDREAHAVDGMHGADLAAEHPGPHRIMLDEVVDLEQRARFGHDAATATASAARQQAARCGPPKSCSGGYSWWQRSIASAQRGAKAQPCGSRVNEGTVPGISASRSLPLVCCVGTAGIEAISPRV